MRFSFALAFVLMAVPTIACDAPVCLTAADDMHFTRTITFDDVPSGYGLGSRIDTVLVRPGAQFGERFLGQTRGADGDHDQITGTALSPLTVLDGGVGETLGVMRLYGTNILLGHGPRGFPATEAVGEGAIAVLFDHDQPALAFDLRGGEAGFATLTFLRRDGHVIHQMQLGPVAEQHFTFLRAGAIADIAGILLTNRDPQGVAIDNLAFGLVDATS